MLAPRKVTCPVREALGPGRTLWNHCVTKEFNPNEYTQVLFFPIVNEVVEFTFQLDDDMRTRLWEHTGTHTLRHTQRSIERHQTTQRMSFCSPTCRQMLCPTLTLDRPMGIGHFPVPLTRKEGKAHPQAAQVALNTLCHTIR